MRAAGVPERYCTGDASDREKFQKWAETVPQTLRNPLYHWTHLELKRPLGISDRLLGPDTAEGIWERVQREARPARVLLPRHHAADERRAGLHDRRSGRHAGTSSGDRGRPRRFRSRCCPHSGPTRRWPSSRPRRSTPGSTGWPRAAASTSATISTAFSTPCGSGTISSTPSAAGSPTTAWRRSTRADYTPAEIAAAFRRVRSGQDARRPTRSSSSSRPCSTNWPR